MSFISTIRPNMNSKELIESNNMRYAGQVARKRQKRNTYRILWKERKRPLERTTRRFYDNIKMKPKESTRL